MTSAISGFSELLGEILVESGMIDGFQLRSALADQKRWGRPLGVTLVKLGFVDEEELLRMLSRQLDVAIVDLKGKRIAVHGLGSPERFLLSSVLAYIGIQDAEGFGLGDGFDTAADPQLDEDIAISGIQINYVVRTEKTARHP